MGQYYKAVNVDNGEWMNAHPYDAGLKLMEHSYTGNNFVCAVKKLLSPGGPWHKARIVWAGDYGEMRWEDVAKDEVTEFASALAGEEGVLYNTEKCHKLEPPEHLTDPEDKFLVNHTKKMFISYARVAKATAVSWSIDPLPLLTSNGNGCGDGDYHGVHEDQCGSWAADSISIEESPPDGFDEIKTIFKEDY